MALLTSDQIAPVNVGLLTRSLVLTQTVTRVPAPSGGDGDTVTVRVASPGAARTQAVPGATITYDDVNETAVPITLAHLYNGKRVTDEERTFSIVDFGAQISAIQVEAVARGAEDRIATAMNGLASEADFALNADQTDTVNTLLEARQLLSAANVPSGDRYLAVSPQISTRLLQVEGFRAADQSGSDSALRDAIIGRLFGFTIVESNALNAGTAVAYHRTGFAFANRAPAQQEGAVSSAVAASGGIQLRHIFQYQPDILSMASVVSTFAGAAVVDPARVVKITTAAV